MISLTLKIAAVLPINPTREVFSRKCGISETIDAGIAMESLFLIKPASPTSFRLLFADKSLKRASFCLKAKNIKYDLTNRAWQIEKNGDFR